MLLDLFMKEITSVIETEDTAVTMADGTVDAVEKGLFDRLVAAVERSYLFREYVSTWAAPFDNASFDAVVLIIIVAVAFWSVFGIVMNLRYRKKARERHAALEAERSEYLRFHRENGPAGEMSFAEWRMLRTVDRECREVKGFAAGQVELTETVASEDLSEDEYEGIPEAEASEKGNQDVAGVGELIADNREPLQESVCIVNTGDLLDKMQEPESDHEQAFGVDGLLEGMLGEEPAKAEPDQEDAFGDLIGNLRQRQRQEARAREIDDAAKEAARQNLQRLKSDMEAALAENEAEQVKKEARDKESESRDLSSAHKQAMRAREKEQQKEQKRMERMQKRGGKWKIAAVSAE